MRRKVFPLMLSESIIPALFHCKDTQIDKGSTQKGGGKRNEMRERHTQRRSARTTHIFAGTQHICGRREETKPQKCDAKMKTTTNLAQELPFAACAWQLAERQLVSVALFEPQESTGEVNPIQKDLRLRPSHQQKEEEEAGLREDLMVKAFALKMELLQAHQQEQEQVTVCLPPRLIHRKILV